MNKILLKQLGGLLEEQQSIVNELMTTETEQILSKPERQSDPVVDETLGWGDMLLVSDDLVQNYIDLHPDRDLVEDETNDEVELTEQEQEQEPEDDYVWDLDQIRDQGLLKDVNQKKLDFFREVLKSESDVQNFDDWVEIKEDPANYIDKVCKRNWKEYEIAPWVKALPPFPLKRTAEDDLNENLKKLKVNEYSPDEFFTEIWDKHGVEWDDETDSEVLEEELETVKWMVEESCDDFIKYNKVRGWADIIEIYRDAAENHPWWPHLEQHIINQADGLWETIKEICGEQEKNWHEALYLMGELTDLAEEHTGSLPPSLTILLDRYNNMMDYHSSSALIQDQIKKANIDGMWHTTFNYSNKDELLELFINGTVSLRDILLLEKELGDVLSAVESQMSKTELESYYENDATAAVQRDKKSSDMIIDTDSFELICREICQDLSPGVCNWEPEAVEILQTVAEEYLVKLFERSGTAASLSERHKNYSSSLNVMVIPRDFQLVQNIRGN
jgi:histone H3/H4